MSGGGVDMSGGRVDMSGGRVDMCGGGVDMSGGRVDMSGGGLVWWGICLVVVGLRSDFRKWHIRPTKEMSVFPVTGPPLTKTAQP